MNRMSRAVVIAVSLAVFFLIVLVLSGEAWAEVTYRLITDGGLVIVWLMTAAAIGHTICRFKIDALHVITEIALGLGVMSLLTLGLGLAGWLNHHVAAGILIAGFGLSVIWLSRCDKTAIRGWMSEPAGWHCIWIVAMVPLAMSVVGALLPPGLLWGDEPNGYDVVEYHFQIPRQWFEAGRITPLSENVFSYFPQGMEMHYLMAMEARNGPWAGMYAAQLMHVAMCALAVAAVGSIAGTLAGVIMAVTPWISLLAPVGYVEGAVLLYGALAVGWAMRSLTSPSPGTPGEGRGGGSSASVRKSPPPFPSPGVPGEGKIQPMLIAGAMAGFACGVKLTDVPMLLFAIPIAMLAVDRTAWLKKSAVFIAIGLIVFSPWLIRNLLWTGNPIFPEATHFFGHGNFSAIQVERWREAYLPTTGRLSALGTQIIWDNRYGLMLFPTAIFLAALRFGLPRVRFLFAMLAILAAIWLGFTHLQSRFFVLAIPISAMLLAEAEWRWRPVGMIGLICFLLVCQIVIVGGRLDHYLSDLGGVHILGVENLAGIAGPDPTTLPSDTHIDLVGDARAFLYPYPSSRLSYRTVFDAGSSGNVIQDWTGRPDIPPHHLLVIDPAELSRLHRTYYQVADLSEDELEKLSARPDVYVIRPAH
jgi:hypothetical protein